jgi:hypothetical protein
MAETVVFPSSHFVSNPLVKEEKSPCPLMKMEIPTLILVGIIMHSCCHDNTGETILAHRQESPFPLVPIDHFGLWLFSL